MLPVLVFLLATLRDSLRTRVGLQAEVLALRHQLLVLQRRNQKRRLQLSAFDRVLWVWLSRIWPDWKSALRIVKPETVIAWHRKGFRLYWRWKSRPRHGRPPKTTEVRELIRRISAANPGWGAPRIHGELGKLGLNVSETTVAKYMVRHRHPPSQTWRTFLANHVEELVSTDFFVVPTATFRLLFVFVILSHDPSPTSALCGDQTSDRGMDSPAVGRVCHGRRLQLDSQFREKAQGGSPLLHDYRGRHVNWHCFEFYRDQPNTRSVLGCGLERRFGSPADGRHHAYGVEQEGDG